SVPFLTPSVHMGTEHFFVAALQTPLVQTVETPQPAPSAHLLGHPPPQSRSVSPPFLTPSVHVGTEHVLVAPSQTPLVQSIAPAQPLPSAHFAQLPPQSVSVSEPFFTVSVHVTGRHFFAVHVALAQSAGTSHAFPSAHFGQP